MINKINYKRILLHIFFWAIVLIVNDLLYAFNSGKYGHVFLAFLSTLPFDILAAYITLYFFIPRYLLKKRYLEFALYFLASVVVIVLIENAINLYFVYPYIYYRPIDKLPFWSIGIFFLAINIYTIVALAVIIKLIKIWYQNQQLHNKLENLNLHSELSLLRNQINPHFLFNTLNNIDRLISKDKNKASDAVIKLSRIMRYMLYEANADKVLLEKEIEYLKSYISLQQLRLKKQNFVDFTIEGDCKGKTISPMLFISFIENAFKHGSKNVDSPGIIIKLIINEQNIQFESTNYFSENQNMNKDKTKGIGLYNVKRRLELLYPDKHELRIIKENEKFFAKLILE